MVDYKDTKIFNKKTSNLVLINSLDKIFDDASVDNCIIFFKKSRPNGIEADEIKNGELNTIGQVNHNFFGSNPIFSISMVKY